MNYQNPNIGFHFHIYGITLYVYCAPYNINKSYKLGIQYHEHIIYRLVNNCELDSYRGTSESIQEITLNKRFECISTWSHPGAVLKCNLLEIENKLEEIIKLHKDDISNITKNFCEFTLMNIPIS